MNYQTSQLRRTAYCWILVVQASKDISETGQAYKMEILSAFKRQINKMAKHTQTICRHFADELFECVWPFCGIGA